MSDNKLRELERRWKETGSVEDEAAYLLERVRAGELTQERLELAAYCGRVIRSDDPTPVPAGDGGWFLGLGRWLDSQDLVRLLAALVAKHSTEVRPEATRRPSIGVLALATTTRGGRLNSARLMLCCGGPSSRRTPI